MGTRGCYCALHKLFKGCSNPQSVCHQEKYIYIQIGLLSIWYIKKHDFVRINFKLLVWHYILCLLLTNCASIGWNSCSHPKQPHKYFISLSVCRRLGDVTAPGEHRCALTHNTHELFPCFSRDGLSARGRWAPNKTIYPRKCPVICSIPVLIPAGPVAVLCAGADCPDLAALQCSDWHTRHT